jgi:CRISPR-associated protein Csx10
MRALNLRVTALSDLFIGGDRSDRNDRNGLEYIPGTTLRGALAAQFPQPRGQRADETFRRLFCTDEVRFMNAYLCHNGQRALPIPRSALTDKHTGGFCAEGNAGVFDCLYAVGNVKPAIPADLVRDVPRGWYAPDGGGFGKAKVARHTSFHNRIEADGVTGTEGLFSRVALQAGSAFQASVCGPDDLLRRLEAKVGKGLPIGLGGKRGDAEVTVEQTVAAPLSCGSVVHKVNGSRYLILSCVSDVILLDPYLRYRPAVPAEWLGGKLGVSLCLKRHFAAFRQVSGWRNVWGLPTADEAAIEKGSCFLYGIEGAPPDDLADRCRALEASGIGLRTGEGFGEIAFCEPFHCEAFRKAGGPL